MIGGPDGPPPDRRCRAACLCLGAGRGLGAGHAPQADRVVIPAGPFTQGSTRGDEDERPAHKVTVKAFAIDRTEVTRGDYAACVAAKRCKAPPHEAADGGAPIRSCR